MSYCRWSSDFWQCDVYVYADCGGGWTTHVAGRRMKHTPPESLRAMPCGTPEEWLARHKATDEWRDGLLCDEEAVNYIQPDGTTKPGIYRSLKDSEYIDLATIGDEAGESYNDDTPGECADRLEALRAKGFNVPQYAIDALREEQLELAQSPNAVDPQAGVSAG